MKLDAASLAIGAGIGVTIVTITMVVFVMQPGKTILDDEAVITAIASNNGSHFFMAGLVKEISEDKMIIDQTFGNPDYHDNPNVKIKLGQGSVFVSCHGTGVPGETCRDSVVSRIDDEKVYVCALTRMYNGEFYAGKIWADLGCGPFNAEENSE